MRLTERAIQDPKLKVDSHRVCKTGMQKHHLKIMSSSWECMFTPTNDGRGHPLRDGKTEWELANCGSNSRILAK